jgi:hypothetical protein
VRWFEIERALWLSTKVTGIDFPARVRATTRQFEPGVVGIFLPILLLPAGIEARLTSEQMRAVLSHERCHLRWRDNFTAWLHMWVEMLFWFFPPVWWIGARMIEERERACDEQVTREGHAPASYAEGILAVCEHYIASRLPCVAGVSGADLRERIENILKNAATLKLDWTRKLALGAMSCCAVAVPLAAGARSGSWVQMAFSSTYTAGWAKYIQTDIALLENLNNARAAHPRAVTCPPPSRDFIDKRQALAAMIAKLKPDVGEEVLLLAVAANSTRDVERLLAGGAMHSDDGFLHSNSLMNTAAQLADVPMLELLLKEGFSVDEWGAQGGIGASDGTPLMSAISMGRLDNADWLIRHGADVSAIGRNGNSALAKAMIDCSDQALVARLISAGAAPDDRARSIARSLHIKLDAAPALIVPNGLPILDARSVQPPEDGQVMVTMLSSDQPLWAPPSFGRLPSPMAASQVQKQWPRPSQQDLDADAWRAASPSRFAEVTADLDGDGRADHVMLGVGRTGWNEAALIQLSSVLLDQWQPLTSMVHDQQSSRPVMGVRVASPGTYLTACGKDERKCTPGEPREVTLMYPGIEYFRYEGGSAYVFWDKWHHQLQRVWTRD